MTILLLVLPNFAFASYLPGETLDPGCVPTDPTCIVTAPAASGANHDITSLLGLTTALSVTEGGTGLSTVPTYGQLLMGNNAGGYTLTGTSTLGLSINNIVGSTSLPTLAGDNIFSGANTFSQAATFSGGITLGGVMMTSWPVGGGGGAGGSFWATSTNSLVGYPSLPGNYALTIGRSSTSSDVRFEVLGNSKLGGNLAVTGGLTIDSLSGVLKASNGLVSGSASTADLPDSINKHYVTDAQLTVLSNTSGVNTGDQDLSSLVPKTYTVNGHSLSSNITITAGDIGLGSVANIDTSIASNINQSASYRFVSDAEKGVWNGKQNAITTGSTAQYLRGDLSLATLDKTAVGLGNVDNTSDAAKNVLSATKLSAARNINGIAFDGTGNITINAASSTLLADNNTFTGKNVFTNATATTLAITGLATPAGAYLAVNPDGTVISTTSPVVFNVADSSITLAKLGNLAYGTLIGRTSGGTGVPEAISTSTYKSMLVLVKGDVGLGNVDNTSDANKPISSAQQTALDLKIDVGTTSIGSITGLPKLAISKSQVTDFGGPYLTAYTETDPIWLAASSSYLKTGTTTAALPDSLNRRYVTDAQLTILSNTSGANTGDQDLSSYFQTANFGATFNSNVNSSSTMVTAADGPLSISNHRITFTNPGYLTSLNGAASSTLLIDNNTFTGKNVFSSATATNFAITGLARPAGAFLAVNADGSIIATTTPQGGGGTWGSITGTLSAQTDLQNALNLKVDNSTTSMSALATLSGLVTIGSTTGRTTILGQTVLNGAVSVGTTSNSQLMEIAAGNLRFDQVSAPVALSGTPAGTGSGSLSAGTYKYVVTYTTAYGETNISPSVSVTTAANDSVDLTIPVSSYPAVTGRKIYRTAVNGLDLKLVKIISDNTTVAYNDSLGDGSRSGNDVTYRGNSTAGRIYLGSALIIRADTNETAMGQGALPVGSGYGNAAFGDNSLAANTSGYYNSAFGENALLYATSSNGNTAIGTGAMSGVNGQSSGGSNTALGAFALAGFTTGVGNVALGYNAGYPGGILTNANGAGSYNVFLGYNAGQNIASTTALSKSIAIGYNSAFSGSNMAVIGGVGSDAIFLGLGTTSPSGTLAIAGTSTQIAPLLLISTSTSNYSTSTALILTANGWLGIGTSSPGSPLAVGGLVIADLYAATNPAATSTFAGGLDVGSGALTYDSNSGVTSVANLATGPLNFEPDAGPVSWVDMPISTSTIAGMVESYTANLGGNAILTIYGVTNGDGNGGLAGMGVTIGSGYASSTAPSGMLTVYGKGVGNVPIANFINAASTTVLTAMENTLVGIGTDTPSAQLAIHANRGGNTPLLLIASSTNGAGTSTELIVDTYGNVGIGTSSPLGILSVQASDNSSAPQFVVGSSTATSLIIAANGNVNISGKVCTGTCTNSADANAGAYFGVGASTSVLGWGANYVNSGTIRGSLFYDGGNTNVGMNAENANLVFRMAGFEALRIDKNTRNLLVGTTSPLARLTVWGSGTGTNALANFVNSASTSLLTILENGSIGIGSSSPLALLSVHSTANSGLSLFTVASSTGGLGTTSTAFQIDAYGNTSIGNGIYYDSNSGMTTLGALSTGNLNFETDAGQVSWADMPVTSASSQGTIVSYVAQLGGNPVLTIGGQVTDANGTVGNLGVTIGTSTPQFASLTVWGDGTGPVANFVNAASSTILTMLENGNVGIGTSTPGTALGVMGSGVFARDVVASYFTATDTAATSQFSGNLLVLGSTTLQNFSAVSGTTTNLAITGVLTATNASATTTLAGSLAVGSNALNVLQNGTVNIGTNSQPVDPYGPYSLYVVGPDSKNVFSIGNAGGSARATMYVSSGSPTAAIQFGTVSNNRFGLITNNGSPQLTLSTNGGTAIGGWGYDNIDSPANGLIVQGFVGMGTSTPYSGLSVWGANTLAGVNLFELTNSASTSLLQIDNAGNANFLVASATTTIAGGFDVGSGGLTYDSSSGVTSISNLATGPLSFESDAGLVSWIDLNISTTTVAGLAESYTAQLGGIPMLTVYGVTTGDGAGGLSGLGIAIGTGLASSTVPSGTLTVYGKGTYNVPIANFVNGASTTVLTAMENTLVGIGTDTPSAQLAVHATMGGKTPLLMIASSTNGVGTTTLAMIDAYGNSQFSGNLLVLGSTTLQNFSAVSGTTTNLAVTGVLTATNASATTTLAGGLAVGSNALNVLQNGTVGIGTAAPTANFQITGTAPNGGFTGLKIVEPNFSNNSISMGELKSSDGSYTEPAIWMGSAVASPSFQNYVFNLDEGNGGAVFNGPNTNNPISFRINNYTKMFVSTAGNVGIGTTTPYSKLTVWGSGTGSNILANFANFASTSLLTILENGNIGIGTTSPYATLSVVGQALAQYFTATDTNSTSTFAGGFTAGNGQLMVDSVSGITSAAALDVGNLNFEDSAGAISWVDMPISTTTLAGMTESYTANLGGNSVLTIYGVTNGDGNGGLAGLGVAIGSGYASSTAPSGMLTVYGKGVGNVPIANFVNAASTTVLTAFENGNIGIGTDTPASLLAISNSASTAANIPLLSIASTTAGNSTSTLMTVFANGNVGIGTANPGSTLDVYIAGTEQFWVNSSSVYANSSFSAPIFRAATNQQMTFGNATMSTNPIYVALGTGVQSQSSGNNVTLDITPSLSQSGTAAATDLLINRTETSLGSGAQYLISAGTGGGTYVSKFSVSNTGQGYFAGNVGIGTTSPAWNLTVSGTRPSFALSDYSAAAGSKHWLLSSMGGYLYIGTSSDAYATTSTAALTLTNGGLLGIGSSTPLALLTIQSTRNDATALFLVASSTGATSSVAMQIDSYGNTSIGNGLYYDATNGGLTTVNGLQTGPLNFEADAGQLSWIDMPVTSASSLGTLLSYSANLGGIPVLTISGQAIDANGNVGALGVAIGSGLASTTIPSGTLTVYGKGVNNVPIANFVNGASTTVLTAMENTMVGIGTDTPSAQLAVHATRGGNTPLLLIASSTNGTGTTTEFIMDAYGNIGMGTSSPIGALAVSSDSFTAPKFVVASSTATSLIVAANGNVGIGTNAPQGKFTVSNGTDSISLNPSGGSRLGFGDGTAVSAYMEMGAYASINNIDTKSRNLRIFSTSDPTGINYLASSGNFGIGTTSPAWNLTVSGTRPSFALSDFSAAAGNKHWLMSSMGGYLYLGTSSDLYATTSIPALTISNSGLVGIGSSSPLAMLTVSATGGGAAPLFLVASSTGATTTVAFQIESNGSVTIGGGNLSYDADTGITSVGSLNATTLNFEADAGAVTWVDLPVSTTTPAGITESYTATLGGNSILTIYGVTNGDGAGGLAGMGVTIGSGYASSTAPSGMLTVYGKGVGNVPIANFINAASTTVLTAMENTMVGIGTDTPSAQLAIHASRGGTTPLLLLASSTAGVATTTLLIVDAYGKMGIGTTSPGTALGVMGSGVFARDVVASYFTATDTTATSTFAGGVNITGNGLNIASAGLIYQNGQKLLQSGVTDDTNFTVGYQAGNSLLSSALDNTFIGYQSGFTATSTNNGVANGGNTGIGYHSLYANNVGVYNTAVGAGSLGANTYGLRNSAFGNGTLGGNTTGSYNTAMGNGTLAFTTAGSNITALGYNALIFNTTGGNSVAVGYQAGAGSFGATASTNNVFVGYQAGLANTTGGNNTLLGYAAGSNLTSGSGNIVLGYNLNAPAANSVNTLNIGNLIFGTSIDGTGSTLSSGNIGIGTSSPFARLSVFNTNSGITPLFSVASSTGATTTIALHIDSYGNTSIGNGLYYDATNGTNGGTTYVPGLSTGNFNFDTDAGQVSWADMPVTAASAQGSIMSYSAQLGGNPVLMVHGLVTDAAGTVGNLGVTIGTSTPGFADLTVWGGNLGPVMSVVGYASTTIMTAMSNGYVGIGTSSPYAALSVVDNGAASLRDVFAISTSTSGTIFRVDSYGGVHGNGAYTSPSGDYAEYFYTDDTDLSAGETVCLDVAKNNAVKRCVRGEDPNLMGIVSTQPSVLGNSQPNFTSDSHYKIIGMLGQLPANASVENGPIAAGDNLTSASKPGYLMKANAGDPTVGVALEPLASDTGTIKVLISRRNQSLTVEEVEQKVSQHIASMNIEDEVNKLVATAATGYDWNGLLTSASSSLAAVINSQLALGLAGVNLKLDSASSALTIGSDFSQSLSANILASFTGNSSTTLGYASTTAELSAATSTPNVITGAFDYLAGKIASGFGIIKELVTVKITAMVGIFEKVQTKNLETENGITTKDKATGEYYCMYVENGQMKSAKGKCDEITPTPTPSTTPAPTNLGEELPSATPTPDVIPADAGIQASSSSMVTPTATPSPSVIPTDEPAAVETPSESAAPAEAPVTPPAEPAPTN